MDHKQLIGFTETQRAAISIAAHGAGLSFTAFVRSAAMAKVAEAGIQIIQPQVD
jgi:hypothetical protein|tara:strand:- start:2440 stop:2601 length:162 start_codon:yes stop_codon:yes gene_type:complete